MVTRMRLFRLQRGEDNIRRFAEKLGIPPHVLYTAERGLAYVSPKYRKRLAEALGVRVEDILDVNGFPLPA